MEEWLLADVQKAVEKEFELALQDRVMEETKDKKNAVEAYVYDLRNKVDEDGEDETEGVYIARLEKLQQSVAGGPTEERYKEHTGNREGIGD
ncbi:hypothetical protein C3L33_04847, partial [Rhododendron williamsianum]